MKLKRTAQTATCTAGTPFETLFGHRNHDWNYACIYSVLQIIENQRCVTNRSRQFCQLNIQGHPSCNMILCYYKNYLDFGTHICFSGRNFKTRLIFWLVQSKLFLLRKEIQNTPHLVSGAVKAFLTPEGNSKYASSFNWWSQNFSYSRRKFKTRLIL